MGSFDSGMDAPLPAVGGPVASGPSHAAPPLEAHLLVNLPNASAPLSPCVTPLTCWETRRVSGMRHCREPTCHAAEQLLPLGACCTDLNSKTANDTACIIFRSRHFGSKIASLKSAFLQDCVLMYPGPGCTAFMCSLPGHETRSLLSICKTQGAT